VQRNLGEVQRRVKKKVKTHYLRVHLCTFCDRFFYFSKQYYHHLQLAKSSFFGDNSPSWIHHCVLAVSGSHPSWFERSAQKHGMRCSRMTKRRIFFMMMSFKFRISRINSLEKRNERLAQSRNRRWQNQGCQMYACGLSYSLSLTFFNGDCLVKLCCA
jgi:hypothetical protein